MQSIIYVIIINVGYYNRTLGGVPDCNDISAENRAFGEYGAMALELQDTFDRARDEAAFKEHRQTMFVHQEGQNDSPDREGSAVILGSGGAARMATEMALKQAKDQESARDTQVLLAILNDRIAQLDTEIAQYESIFEARFGDAWREEIAVRVLDDDEMPVRHDDEKMSGYRQRVEDAVVEKMIDPETGKMRPEYANHPEFKEYGEWAEREFEQRNAKALANEIETASPERVAEINHEVRENDSFNQLEQIDQELAGLDPNNEGVGAIKQASVETKEELFSEDLDQQGLSLNEGGGMFGGMSPN